MVSAKISGVVPVRLVPCSKVMETMIGRSLSARMAATAMRTSARSNCVSMRNRSTPPSTRPRACSRRASYSSSGCRSPSGRTNCPHGPMSPATKASRPAASTAARAIRAIVRLNGVTSMPAGSLRRRAAEGARQNDVRARGEVVGVDPPEHVRPIEAELFRVFPGGQAPCLQHGPHAPVEQQGTPGGECATKIRHAVLLYGILPLHGRAGLEWLVNRSPHQTARALPLGFCLLKIVEKDKPKL